ncbi:MAG: helix-turn-helix domain-containing protein [Thermomicrobiales bacterium]
MSRLGVCIRELRDARGWTQEELGERAGVPQTTVSSLESGRVTRTSDANMAGLAQALGVPRRVLYAAAGLIETEEELQWIAQQPDALTRMVARVRADRDVMDALEAERLACEAAGTPEVFEEVIESFAQAWLANARMGLRVAKTVRG